MRVGLGLADSAADAGGLLKGEAETRPNPRLPLPAAAAAGMQDGEAACDGAAVAGGEATAEMRCSSVATESVAAAAPAAGEPLPAWLASAVPAAVGDLMDAARLARNCQRLSVRRGVAALADEAGGAAAASGLANAPCRGGAEPGAWGATMGIACGAAPLPPRSELSSAA